MDEQPFPLPRATRETEILDGDGGAVYGPFGFKIFDTEDVRAYVRHAGEDWQTAAVTAHKVAGLEFDDFTVTFAEAVPATSDYLVQGSRLHGRQTAVTRGGAISGRALEKELSKQASVLEELWRDVTRGISAIPGMPGQILVFGPDGKVRPGVDQSEIANAAGYASAANEARERAEAAETAAADAAASAAAAQAAAEGAAAGVHLPIIGSGDAGKSLVVNQAEDGYELLDERGVVRVANRTALKALDGTKTPVAYLYGEGGRNGTFVWNPGNFSAGVAADTAEGIYIKADAVAATSGAWVRVFQPPLDVRWWGAKGDDATDDSAAIQAALDFIKSQGDGWLLFAPGTYLCGSKIELTLANAPQHIRLSGAGPGTCAIKFQTTDGLEFVYADTFNRMTLEGFSILAGTENTKVGLKLTQSASVMNPALTPVTRLSDLMFRGSDGFQQDNVWATGFLNEISNTNMRDCMFIGNTAGAGIATKFQGVGNNISVVFQIIDCTFNGLGSGISIGDQCQGVFVKGINVIANYGVSVDPNGTHLDQLQISDSHFNCPNIAIFDQTGFANLKICNSYFIVGTDGGSCAIQLNGHASFQITGNSFLGNPSASPLFLNINGNIAASLGGGVISGNLFKRANTAIWLQSGAENINVQSNKYLSVSTTVTNNGTGNTVGSGSE